MSRIFYRSKYYAYPLKPMNALLNMGAVRIVRIMLSYAKWQVRPSRTKTTFEQWVTNRFGGRLFWHFFKSYTEKVWGIPCNEIRADWAAQRDQESVAEQGRLERLSGSNDTDSLIEKFDYPRLGPGMMWEAFRDRVEKRAARSACSRGSAEYPPRRPHESAQWRSRSRRRFDLCVQADEFISSMPITALVENMVPPAPDHVVEPRAKLRYRDFLIVTLIIKKEFVPGQLDLHPLARREGRPHPEFPLLVGGNDPRGEPLQHRHGIFLQRGRRLWDKDDEELLAQAEQELRS